MLKTGKGAARRGKGRAGDAADRLDDRSEPRPGSNKFPLPSSAWFLLQEGRKGGKKRIIRNFESCRKNLRLVYLYPRLRKLELNVGISIPSLLHDSIEER